MGSAGGFSLLISPPASQTPHALRITIGMYYGGKHQLAAMTTVVKEKGRDVCRGSPNDAGVDVQFPPPWGRSRFVNRER